MAIRRPSIACHARGCAARFVFSAAAFAWLTPAVLAGEGRHVPTRSASDQAAATGRQSVIVLVDNLARLRDTELVAAQGVASGVLRSAGVKSVWLDCRRHSSSPVARQVWVVLGAEDRSEQMLARLQAPKDVLGMALPRAGRVYVFSERIRRYAARKRLGFEDVLGYVLAHEVGHHLLPDEGHTGTGIMQADIGDTLATAWFTSRQATSIRSRVGSTPAMAEVARAERERSRERSR